MTDELTLPTHAEPTRPIIGIENRTAQEVFDIMCDRVRRYLVRSGLEAGKAEESMRERAANAGYRVCAETRHLTLGEAVNSAIRALPLTGASHDQARD